MTIEDATRVCLLFGAALVSACQLMPILEEDPSWCLEGGEGYGQTRELPCGVCNLGIQQWYCDPDQGLIPVGECVGNPFDADGDGYSNETCLRTGRECCGQLDCDDTHPERWPGHADADGDGHIDVNCCVGDGCTDCDDNDPSRWTGEADRDGDGFIHGPCCDSEIEICDCDDDDRLRWDGQWDLDGDGHVYEGCGGDDCDDDDPMRWTGHADLDGDGFIALSCGGTDCDDTNSRRYEDQADLDGDGHDDVRCGGTDCNDDDPDRWIGRADLDNDGHLDMRCCDADGICGDDCDDDCSDCVPGGSALSPGMPGFVAGFDRNCDGLVDELNTRRIDFNYPCTIQSITEVGSARDVVMVSNPTHATGNHLFVTSDTGLHHLVPDDEDRTQWVEHAQIELLEPRGLFYAGNHLFVTTFEGLVVIQPWAESGELELAGSLPIRGLRDVAVTYDYAYAISPYELHVIDVFVPTWPMLVATAYGPPLTPERREVFRRVFAVGDHAYVAGVPDQDGSAGLYIFEIDDPTVPVMHRVPATRDCPADRTGRDVFISGGFAATAGTGGVAAFDLANPLEPECFDSIDRLHVDGSGLFVAESVVYVAGAEGMWSVDMTPGSLVAPPAYYGLCEPRSIFVTPRTTPSADPTAFVATSTGVHVINLACE